MNNKNEDDFFLQILLFIAMMLFFTAMGDFFEGNIFSENQSIMEK